LWKVFAVGFLLRMTISPPSVAPGAAGRPCSWRDSRRTRGLPHPKGGRQERQLTGLYPLLPLMRGGRNETPREALQESIYAVEEVEDEAVRKGLLAAMAIQAEGRYSSELVRSMIRREMLMGSAVFSQKAAAVPVRSRPARHHRGRWGDRVGGF